MLQPLLLTLLGAAGTGIGGMMVVLQPQLSWRRLGALQGLAAGLMLSISLVDLLPEAAAEIGFIPANLCFYAGALFFAAIVALIPEPDAAQIGSKQPQQQQLLQVQQQSIESGDLGLCSSLHNGGDASPPATPQQQGKPDLQSMAAAATAQQQHNACGSTEAVAAAAGAVHNGLTQPVRRSTRRSSTAAAAAAAAAAAQQPSGLVDATPPSKPQQQQQQQTPHSPVSSCGGSTDLQVLLTEDQGSAGDKDTRHRQQLLMSGLITAVGIALHNFPEGLAVLLASHKSTAVGVSLACAIALHNIPEGVSVALPVYFATGSRWKGLQMAVLSGLAEPLAVVLLGLLLPFVQLNKHVVDGMLASVGGIMAFLAMHELLPLSLEHAGKPLAIGCLFGGMCLMSVTLHYLNTHLLADMH